MLIAKGNIMSKTKTFRPGDVLTELTTDEEKRLIRLGVAECIAEEIQGETDPEIEAFRAVLEEMTLKEKVEYAKKAEVDLGKAKSNKEVAEKLLQDAGEKGVDIDAMSDGRLFLYAKKVGVETEGKDRENVTKEIEALFNDE